MTIALRQRPLARVVAGIVRANDGAIFDTSDMSTMFQDAAGTTPVTAVEQPVGKMLDKSGNGYHATQSITASRPTLSARHNLCLSTEDIRSYYLFNAGGSAFGPQTVACDSTNNAGIRAIEFNASIGNIRSGVKVGTYSFSCELRKTAGSAISSVYINIDEGNCTVSSNTIPSSIITLTDNWIKYTGTVTISAIGTAWRIWVYRAGTTPTGNFDIRNIHINEGETLLPYQRVNTSTDYDTDERYFPKFLRFDGVDDYLNLPYMGLYANGSASVVLARDSYRSAGSQTTVSEGNNSTSMPFYNPTKRIANFASVTASIRGNSGAIVKSQEVFPEVISALDVRSTIDTGSLITHYRNGVSGSPASYSRAGSTLTLTHTTIGALQYSAPVVDYANMKVYGLIITKSALTDSQRVACERYLGRKSGVQL